MSIFLQSSNVLSDCVHFPVKLVFTRGHTISMRSECYESWIAVSKNGGELIRDPSLAVDACKDHSLLAALLSCQTRHKHTTEDNMPHW